jgi:hypothetical protein
MNQLPTLLLILLLASSAYADDLRLNRVEYTYNQACQYYDYTPDLDQKSLEYPQITDTTKKYGKLVSCEWSYPATRIIEKEEPVYLEKYVETTELNGSKTLALSERTLVEYKTTYLYERYYSSDFSLMETKEPQEIRVCCVFEREYVPGRGLTIEYDIIPTVNQKTYAEYEWFNDSLLNRYQINCSGIGDNVPLMVNGTGGININGSQEHIWTHCSGDTYLYYHNASSYSIANDTASIPFEVEKGYGKSYLASSVWVDEAYVYHLTNTTETKAGLSGRILGNAASRTSNIILNGTYFDGTGDAINETKLNPAGNKWGVSFYFNGTHQVSGEGHMVSGIGGGETLYIAILDTGKFYLNIHDGSKTCINNADLFGANYEDNATHKFDLIVDGDATMTYGVDGKYTTASLTCGTIDLAAGYQPYIGAKNNAGALQANRDFTGTIDELRFYTSVVSTTYLNASYRNYLRLPGYGDVGSSEVFIPINRSLNLSLNTPLNETQNGENISFNFTVTGTNASYGNCTLYLNGTLNESIKAMNNTPSQFNMTYLGPGVWLWNVSCWINMTLSNHSETWIYEVTTTTTTTAVPGTTTTTLPSGPVYILFDSGYLLVITDPSNNRTEIGEGEYYNFTKQSYQVDLYEEQISLTDYNQTFAKIETIANDSAEAFLAFVIGSFILLQIWFKTK